MKLENGYKKVYTVNEDGVRTLHATKDVLNPAADEVIVDKAKAQTLKTANFYQDGNAIRYVLGADRAIDRKVDAELVEVRKLFVPTCVHNWSISTSSFDATDNTADFTLRCANCGEQATVENVPCTFVQETNKYHAGFTYGGVDFSADFDAPTTEPTPETPVAEPETTEPEGE